ncbi:mitochondrial phosphate carrier 3, mitochondrial-like [Olea europaea subsp. europaea]|uniref:Mitochondrial phosphate carrier 3, mitochondrial-like n=1 Tax=Olea europaea subsp. europaea TaxID=158383 RepID=A0A8S0PUT2_OLEEU|nr:mitochondrial phosphate carrier 3, mitochondrial-like [Olea europaea subsp. europaea]
MAMGACKFGFYEYFKKYYSDLAGPENAVKCKTLIYLAGSASAEVIADIALCPFEAVKVRVQTQPAFARGLSDGLPKFVKSEGALGVPILPLSFIFSFVRFISLQVKPFTTGYTVNVSSYLDSSAHSGEPWSTGLPGVGG